MLRRHILLAVQRRRLSLEMIVMIVMIVTIGTQTVTIATQAVPWLRLSIAGLSPRRPGFYPGLVHVGFVVDKVAVGQVSLRELPLTALLDITFEVIRDFKHYFLWFEVLMPVAATLIRDMTPCNMTPSPTTQQYYI